VPSFAPTRREINARSDDPNFVQVMIPAGARMPFGNRLYHPIYEAAERAGMPICIHFGAEGAGFGNARALYRGRVL